VKNQAQKEHELKKMGWGAQKGKNPRQSIVEEGLTWLRSPTVNRKTVRTVGYKEKSNEEKPKSGGGKQGS